MHSVSDATTGERARQASSSPDPTGRGGAGRSAPRRLDQIGPGAGSVVMGTGIVSIALAMDKQAMLSRSILAIAAAMWIVLVVVLGCRLVRYRTHLLGEVRSPAALTGVAATAVLGAGALEVGWTIVAWLLLATAFVAWAPLTCLVLSGLGRRADGQWFMLTVATEGLAVLVAELVRQAHAGWLVPAALVRFDWHDLACARGEHWIGGGSLAISALAFSQIALADRHLRTMQNPAALADIAVVIWVGAMLWLGGLLVAELRWPRLHYHARRWSTVFPLGMYAVCSFSVAAAAGAPLAGHFARAWTWIALAGWAGAFAGMLRRGSAGGGVRMT